MSERRLAGTSTTVFELLKEVSHRIMSHFPFLGLIKVETSLYKLKLTAVMLQVVLAVNHHHVTNFNIGINQLFFQKSSICF